MRSKKTSLFVICSALTLTWCSSGGDHGQRPAEAGPAVAVRVEAVAPMTQSGTLEVTGTVMSRTITPVAARIQGYVTAVPVREGERVRQGRLLVEIDSRDAQSRLVQAEAALAEAESAVEEVERAIAAAESAREAAEANAVLARSTFQRFEALLERKSVSQQEFDEAAARDRAAQAQLQQAAEMLRSSEARRSQVRSRIEQARAAVEQSRLSLEHCRITAPASAVVSSKQVEVGQLASPGVVLMMLEDPKNFEVEAVVSESRIDLVEIGASVPVRVRALAKSVDGRVYEILPRADPLSRSFIVKVRLPEVSGFRSGLYATVGFPGGSSTQLTVPEESLVRRGQLVGVFVLDGEKARFRLVKTGARTGERVEILSGLSAGDRVIVEPLSQIRDGSPVRVTESIVDHGSPLFGEAGHNRTRARVGRHS